MGMNKVVTKKGGLRMNRGSTYFLRFIVIVLGAVALLIAVLILPAINREWNDTYPEVAGWKYPLITLLASTIVPYFIALYQTMRLLGYIDRNKAFSKKSVVALRQIKYCAAAFSALYVPVLPLVYHVADKEDAPGIMVIGLVMCFAPFVIAAFAAVLERLLQSALAIKSENDLTV